MLISGQCSYIGADGVDFWRVVECSTFPNQTRPSWTSVPCHPCAWPPRGKKSSQSAETGFWGCFASTERGVGGGGVKRLVVSTSSAKSVAWVSVSYYTNAKLVKKDLCIASNYFCFFPLALLSYLTHTKTICKELEECPSHNSPLCGEVTAVLVIQLNETAEHDSGSIKYKKKKKRCRTLYFSWVTLCL